MCETKRNRVPFAADVTSRVIDDMGWSKRYVYMYVYMYEYNVHGKNDHEDN